MAMLSRKVALVIGVGRATVLELAQRGADVAERIAVRSVEEIEDTATRPSVNCAWPFRWSGVCM